MQEVCDILEQLVSEGFLKRYAIGGATAAGFHGEPLATRDIDVFIFIDPPAGSMLVTLEPLNPCIRGSSNWDIVNLRKKEFSSTDYLSNFSARHPGWNPKPLKTPSSQSGKITESAS